MLNKIDKIITAFCELLMCLFPVFLGLMFAGAKNFENLGGNLFLLEVTIISVFLIYLFWFDGEEDKK